MLIKDLKKLKEFMAGDESVLREILHPDKDDIKARYSLAHAAVKPGKETLPHKLKTSEVYYILEGKGMINIDDEEKEVSEGQTVYIPPNAKQYIKNIGENDLKFLAIVDPAWRGEDEEVYK